jgi:hypothetical protein
MLYYIRATLVCKKYNCKKVSLSLGKFKLNSCFDVVFRYNANTSIHVIGHNNQRVEVEWNFLKVSPMKEGKTKESM